MSDYRAVADFLEGSNVTDEDIRAAYGIYMSYNEATERIIRAWADRVKSALEADRQKGEINAVIDANRRHDKEEFDYLLINYPQRKVGIIVLATTYEFSSRLPSNTLFWGICAFMDLKLTNQIYPVNNPLISKLMEKYNVNQLKGNMIKIWPLEHKTNPEQLNEMRNQQKIFLYKEIFDLCKELEVFSDK